jgi:hypothetical protein
MGNIVKDMKITPSVDAVIQHFTCDGGNFEALEHMGDITAFDGYLKPPDRSGGVLQW